MSFSSVKMSSSVKIRVPAEEYVIYFTLTDQSNYRITLDCSIITLRVNYLLSPTMYIRPALSELLKDKLDSVTHQNEARP